MNDNNKNILFPTDFSETANNALMIAINLAKREDTILHLLHVVVPQFSSVSRSHEVWQELEKQNKKGLKKLAQALEKQYKITVDYHTSINYIHAAESIEQLAEELSISLIVMGLHGLSERSPLFMGSNAYTVIKNVSCPVLAIPVGYKKYSFQKILLPVRRLAEIENTFKIIAHFFQAACTRVEFLGVAPFTDFTSFDCLTNKIEKLTKHLKNKNIEVIHRNEFCEDIADFILEYADTTDVELLVINPLIDDGWRSFTLGTYAQKMFNHAIKPVLCIKPEEYEEQPIDYQQSQMKNT